MKKKIGNQSQQDIEIENEDRKEYLDYRKNLNDSLYQISDSFDKTIITLAGGALGLSITFIHEIAPHPDPTTLPTLTTAWAFLVAALLSILLSLLTSQRAKVKEIEEVDNAYNPEGAPGLPTNPVLRLIIKIATRFDDFLGWGPITPMLNLFAILFTIAGIALLAVFSVQNAAHI